jgi:transcriptional regulator with XRE-family HTH domain
MAENDKKEIMSQIGQALVERRKLRKLSISDISQALKIRSSYIEAIETGDWKELPGEVYVRGFCMRYAQYLGLNGQDLMAPYLDKSTVDARSSGELSPQYKKADSVKSPWVWAGVGLLFVAGLIKFLKPPEPVVAPTITKPALQTPKNEAPAPVNEPPKLVQKHKLDIFTPEQLWLRVKSTDRTFEGFIPERTTWTFSGEGQFDVRMGHTRNIAIVFDGQSITAPGEQKRLLLPQ